MNRSASLPTPAAVTAVLRPVDPALPAGPQVFAQLRAAILDMSLPPGHNLSEPEIGAALGVSRTPVREALARLRAIALVTTRPSRGSSVTHLNEAHIREAQFLREALEVAQVRKLATNGVPSAFHEQTVSNLTAQADAVSNNDMPAFHQLDDAFHIGLADATGFSRAAVVLAQEKAQLDRLRILSLHDASHLGALYEEHSAIYAAIVARDAEAAVVATQAHLQSVLSVLHALAADHADYFDPAT
ncbi:MAG: GntR family transcriptional regulator [Pseudomonadota bacterium]